MSAEHGGGWGPGLRTEQEADLPAMWVDAEAQAVRDTLEEEGLMVSSYTSDSDFDAVLGYLEDIIMHDGQVPNISNFMD